MTPIPLIIRAPIEHDEAFITSSFLKSWRDHGDNASMTNDVYYTRMAPVAQRIARGPVILAVNPEDEWQVFGWLAFDAGRMHYAYVKSSYRRMGVFTRMHEAANSPRIVTRLGRMYPTLRPKFALAYDPGEQA